ncbi:MAG: type VI secretion system membrane subunit TssM [Pseudomonadota bacterium]|nr:type VI secretion system membrane subunit TssM [Pseudomonadota bacterium]
MSRLWQFLSSVRVLSVIGLAALMAVLFLGAESLEFAAMWAVAAALALLLGWGVFWLVRRAWRKHAAAQLADMLVAGNPGNPGDGQNEAGTIQPAPLRNDVAVLRKGMLEAISTIKTSKLGLTRGAAALYELPWYMVIGNPAAGKSSAIGRSGLTFPIPGSKAVQGVGGTRNCDWFFTTDGILLDTAGRYSVLDGDRAEWFSFLDLLKRHRKQAPINGILIAVSVAELAKGAPEASLELAKNLRTRVQELTERLGVYAPVYVIFTKADLIAGFADFFHDTDPAERERAWGATLRYNRRSTSVDVLGFFDQHFDELHDGLKELSLASMAGNRSVRMRPGVFTFPLEFASLKLPLRAFLATLFEENTYQFKPVFRGFYFNSALQEGAVESLSGQRVASRFDLKLQDAGATEAAEQSGYFLLDLFRKVIFADRDLVKRYASPTSRRLKYTAFFAATILLGCALGGWSWSYMNNRQLVANVQADLDKVMKLQEKRLDLQSRLEGLDILQDRIEQLDQYQAERPLMLRFGLYQGEALERKLRDEYFAGVREVMAQPVATALEAVLGDLVANPGQLDVAAGATPASITDHYNALKTYLMLGDKTRAEQGHLNDQLTRYWRGWLDANRGTMPREQMIRSAERLLTFHLSHIDDPAWPQLPLKLSLLDGARENLRRVVRGTPARERVYGDIKARAATRFPMMTVARIVGEQDQALIVGSHAISGAFTRDAWEKYVEKAVRDAANGELRSSDWVLKTASRDDLTLEGSPEQIQKSLTDLYKAEYAREWSRFVQGVSISELAGFEASVQAMNRLGDTQTSPINKLLKTIYQETSWDNPGGASVPMSAVQKGVLGWVKEKMLRSAPSEARVVTDTFDPTRPGAAVSLGVIGREFTGVARLLAVREKEASLMSGYLDALARVRTRLNQLKNQGDPGPGAKQFMQQTLEGSGSELADALKYVDEQMLTGMGDAQKQVLRPLLVRPLMQTFTMIVLPSESEINKTWQVQVVEPFRKNLAEKYPFAPGSTVEATNAEIGQVFGPDGVVAKFVTASMGPLVVRRGDVLAARTWADIGITLAPQAVASFPSWIAPLSANGVAAANGPQTVFQVQPLPAPGTLEYTVEIDGQQLRYRNTPPAWTNMVHPGPQGAPGAKISAVTFDGRSVELFNEPGQFGLQRLIESAAKTRKGQGWFELRWNVAGVAVAIELKITSDAAGNGNNSGSPQGKGFAGLRLPEAIVGRTPGAPLPAAPGGPAVASLAGSAP